MRYRATNAHTHTHTRTHARTHARARLTALFPGLPWWAGTTKVKPIWILLKQETVSGSGSGISWAICKSAPRSRQITTPASHHSVFYRPDALPATQPTASKHWRNIILMMHGRECDIFNRGSSYFIVAWPTTRCFADWSKRRHVTLFIIEWSTRHGHVTFTKCKHKIYSTLFLFTWHTSYCKYLY